MAIGVHAVTTGLKNISPTGTVINKTSSTIGQVITSTSDHRVLLNVSVPNSAGFPTIEQYIAAEALDDYVVYHMDQYCIVTYSQADINDA